MAYVLVISYVLILLPNPRCLLIYGFHGYLLLPTHFFVRFPSVCVVAPAPPGHHRPAADHGLLGPEDHILPSLRGATFTAATDPYDILVGGGPLDQPAAAANAQQQPRQRRDARAQQGGHTRRVQAQQQFDARAQQRTAANAQQQQRVGAADARAQELEWLRQQNAAFEQQRAAEHAELQRALQQQALERAAAAKNVAQRAKSTPPPGLLRKGKGRAPAKPKAPRAVRGPHSKGPPVKPAPPPEDVQDAQDGAEAPPPAFLDDLLGRVGDRGRATTLPAPAGYAHVPPATNVGPGMYCAWCFVLGVLLWCRARWRPPYNSSRLMPKSTCAHLDEFRRRCGC